MVTSNAKDFDLRAAQREAFPTRVLENAGIKRVFLLARDAAVSQSEVEAENESHRDIVQGNFEELYRQLGYKHIMGLQWAVTYCRNARYIEYAWYSMWHIIYIFSGYRYILKMDDDIMVDFYQLLAKLQSDYPSLDNVVLGYKQFGLTPQRNRKSKWFVSKAEFAGNVYPDFLSGWAWATSTSTAVRLVNQSRRVPFFWIDDLWVTGVLAGVAGGIRVESLNTFYTVYAEHMECCVAEENTDKLCDFIVGPSLDRTELIVKFGRLSQRCHEMGCERRTWKDSVVKTCVKIDNPYFLPHNSPGVGEVIVLPNKMLL